MKELTALSQQMQDVLQTYAKKLGHDSGFIQRNRKFDGATFVQTLVFGWLSKPTASLSTLANMASVRGVSISAQGLSERFTEAAAIFLKQVLLYATGALSALSAQVPIDLLKRFKGVYIIDTTVIGLPGSLKSIWQGSGGNTAKAGLSALKLEAQLELSRGTLQGPTLQNGRDQDKTGEIAKTMLEPRSLRITDLGYFTLEWFANLSTHGVYWLSRYKNRTNLYDERERQIDLAKMLRSCERGPYEWPIYLGAKHKLGCRLIAVPIPEAKANERRRKLRRERSKQKRTATKDQLYLCGWTLLVTNADSLSISEAVALYRSRWQIELVFKLWKSHGGLAHSRSEKPWRILCEIYAKMIAMLIQHWILVKGIWAQAQKSMPKAAEQVRFFALSMARNLDRKRDLKRTLDDLMAMLSNGCSTNKRRKKPSTFQILLDPELIPLT